MNFTKLCIVIGTALALSLQVGCTAASDADTSRTSASTVDAAPGATLDQTCAGLAGIQCAAGLTCVIPAHDPRAGDVAGKCAAAIGEEGALCGGIAAAALECHPGLICVLDPMPVGSADGSGRCHAATPSPGKIGSTCAGIANLACDAGLFCDVASPHADASGSCIEVKPGELGSGCGGLAGLRCTVGLRCALSKDVPDGAGTCLR